MARRVDVTEADLLQALADAVKPKAAVRPRGFYTIAELAQKGGQHPTRVRDRMRLLSAQGRVERARIYVERADGSVMPVTAYKLKAA